MTNDDIIKTSFREWQQKKKKTEKEKKRKIHYKNHKKRVVKKGGGYFTILFKIIKYLKIEHINFKYS